MHQRKVQAIVGDQHTTARLGVRDVAADGE
jgi:hypothetical protein